MSFSLQQWSWEGVAGNEMDSYALCCSLAVQKLPFLFYIFNILYLISKCIFPAICKAATSFLFWSGIRVAAQVVALLFLPPYHARTRAQAHAHTCSWFLTPNIRSEVVAQLKVGTQTGSVVKDPLQLQNCVACVRARARVHASSLTLYLYTILCHQALVLVTASFRFEDRAFKCVKSDKLNYCMQSRPARGCCGCCFMTLCISLCELPNESKVIFSLICGCSKDQIHEYFCLKQLTHGPRVFALSSPPVWNNSLNAASPSLTALNGKCFYAPQLVLVHFDDWNEKL